MKINVIHHINRLKKKGNIIISNDIEKSFDKIKYSFMIKTLSNLGIEGNYLNLKKSIYTIPKANIIFYGERLNVFSLLLVTREG